MNDEQEQGMTGGQAAPAPGTEVPPAESQTTADENSSESEGSSVTTLPDTVSGRPLGGTQNEETEGLPGATTDAGVSASSTVEHTEHQVEPPPPSPGGFWPGLALGLVVGGALCAVLLTLLRRKLRGGKPVRRLRCETVQGLGARKDQQDSFFLSDETAYGQMGLLACVADGMGGLANGAEVSRIAAADIGDVFRAASALEPERLMVTLVLNANASVNQKISPNFGSSGSTLVLGYVRDSALYLASVGDSRICLCRDGALTPLNRPHVFEQELLLHHINGNLSYDQAMGYDNKGALTSYLGMGVLKYADLPRKPIPLRRGDRIILMSDGVFNTLTDKEIIQALYKKPGRIGEELRQRVEAKKMPYQDNFTAVVLVAE